MWLWILSALIIILAWAAYFMLGFQIVPTWVPIAVTGAVVLFVIGVIVFRRIRAARAARALEKAIAQQAQEQALAAKPERVAEIQELHRQFQTAISALKGSKLGGGKRGADALYVATTGGLMRFPGVWLGASGNTFTPNSWGSIAPFQSADDDYAWMLVYVGRIYAWAGKTVIYYDSAADRWRHAGLEGSATYGAAVVNNVLYVSASPPNDPSAYELWASDPPTPSWTSPTWCRSAGAGHSMPMMPTSSMASRCCAMPATRPSTRSTTRSIRSTRP